MDKNHHDMFKDINNSCDKVHFLNWSLICDVGGSRHCQGERLEPCLEPNVLVLTLSSVSQDLRCCSCILEPLQRLQFTLFICQPRSCMGFSGFDFFFPRLKTHVPNTTRRMPGTTLLKKDSRWPSIMTNVMWKWGTFCGLSEHVLADFKSRFHLSP